MNTPKTHAFVTGATGFVGAHLVYGLLEKGYRVSALLRSQKNLSAFQSLADLYPTAMVSDVTWIDGDLLNPEAWIEDLQNTDVVFHAAAQVSFYAKDKAEMMETNVQGTAHVVNACLKYNIDLIHVSSVAALGRAEEHAKVTENTTWKNTDHNTDYAISKYLAEQEVWRGMEEGLRAAVVCPGIIIGPWGKNTGSGQIPALVKKKLPFYPVGENGFVGVRDVAAMMIALWESRCFGYRFLCVAENTTYKNVMTLFAEGFGVSSPNIPLSGALLRMLSIVSAVAEMFRIPFPFPSQGLKSTSLKTRYISVNKEKLLDFTYLPLKNTIKETTSVYNKLAARFV